MATKKPKKNIKQFKQALFSNTDFIKESGDEVHTKPAEVSVNDEVIEPELREKIQLLAEFEGTTEREMVSKAINHFLRLKGLQLEEALKRKKNL